MLGHVVKLQQALVDKGYYFADHVDGTFAEKRTRYQATLQGARESRHLPDADQIFNDSSGNVSSSETIENKMSSCDEMPDIFSEFSAPIEKQYLVGYHDRYVEKPQQENDKLNHETLQNG